MKKPDDYPAEFDRGDLTFRRTTFSFGGVTGWYLYFRTSDWVRIMPADTAPHVEFTSKGWRVNELLPNNPRWLSPAFDSIEDLHMWLCMAKAAGRKLERVE
jgi:hypothetical protein